jgi:tryptophan halogenase
VLNSETGFIEKVILENNTVIDGDLFIDCSGFSQVLIKKLNPEWDDYSNFLPVNTAIPFNVLADTREKKLYTTAKAMTSGWLWEIPTRNHINQGYIFCDRFINEEQAIAEIKKNYNSDIEYIKTIKFKAGKLKKSWIKNCVAIGLSSAFLEPLQATSIHCTVAQIEDFTNNCLGNSIETTLVNESIQAYNQRVSNLYASMADLISLHYSGGRQDTEFWKFMSDKKSKKVMEILKVASIRGTRFSDFELYYPYAGQGIWNHTIAGLGHFDREVLGNLFLEFNVDLYQSTNELKNLYRHNIKMFENCLSLKELDDYLRLINV